MALCGTIASLSMTYDRDGSPMEHITDEQRLSKKAFRSLLGVDYPFCGKTLFRWGRFSSRPDIFLVADENSYFTGTESECASRYSYLFVLLSRVHSVPSTDEPEVVHTYTVRTYKGPFELTCF